MRGTACRTECATVSMSLVVRATRSPELARSTVDSGSRATAVRNSSRSWANTVSASTSDDRRAHQVSVTWAARQPASTATKASMPPEDGEVSSRSTIRPMSIGPASPAVAASPCSSRTVRNGTAWWRNSVAAKRRVCLGVAIGSS
jgi:hypothetical protein